jgi:hypothetical protein
LEDRENSVIVRAEIMRQMARNETKSDDGKWVPKEKKNIKKMKRLGVR